jgi:hypothetical protein
LDVSCPPLKLPISITGRYAGAVYLFDYSALHKNS